MADLSSATERAINHGPELTQTSRVAVALANWLAVSKQDQRGQATNPISNGEIGRLVEVDADDLQLRHPLFELCQQRPELLAWAAPGRMKIHEYRPLMLFDFRGERLLRGLDHALHPTMESV